MSAQLCIDSAVALIFSPHIMNYWKTQSHAFGLIYYRNSISLFSPSLPQLNNILWSDVIIHYKVFVLRWSSVLNCVFSVWYFINMSPVILTYVRISLHKSDFKKIFYWPDSVLSVFNREKWTKCTTFAVLGVFHQSECAIDEVSDGFRYWLCAFT